MRVVRRLDIGVSDLHAYARSDALAAVLRARAPLNRRRYVGAPGEPAFGSGWTNADAADPAWFLKDDVGFVHFGGSVHRSGGGGTGFQLIFALPSSMRPAFDVYLPGIYEGANGNPPGLSMHPLIAVNDAGQVIAQVNVTGGTAVLYLGGRSFQVA